MSKRICHECNQPHLASVACHSLMVLERPQLIALIRKLTGEKRLMMKRHGEAKKLAGELSKKVGELAADRAQLRRELDALRALVEGEP